MSNKIHPSYSKIYIFSFWQLIDYCFLCDNVKEGEKSSCCFWSLSHSSHITWVFTIVWKVFSLHCVRRKYPNNQNLSWSCPLEMSVNKGLWSISLKVFFSRRQSIKIYVFRTSQSFKNALSKQSQAFFSSLATNFLSQWSSSDLFFVLH